jgi:hypothetical protein
MAGVNSMSGPVAVTISNAQKVFVVPD